MFEIFSTFVNDITKFEVPIPLNLKIAIVVIIILALIIGAYFGYEFFEYGPVRQGYMWFIFIALANLITILVLFIYYKQKNSTIVGKPGKRGKRGTRGKKGKYVSCNYCKNNIYLQRVRKADKIATLSTYTEEFKDVYSNVNYFNNIMGGDSDNINYDAFVNGILLNNTVDSRDSKGVDKFRFLIKSKNVAIYLIKIINENIGKASDKTFGTFRNPYGKVGYTPLGDSVYGGLEKFELNYIMASGNVMYPASYDKLVSISSFNEKTGDIDTYTIWRPVGQVVNEKGFKGETVKNQFISLGDVCKFGTDAPNINDYVTIGESCLEETDPNKLVLAFVYVGGAQFQDDKAIDYTQSNTYLIENKKTGDIEIFSAWRTPLNTFLTNSNSTNELTNDTIAYNMTNGLTAYLNEYGSASVEAKAKMKKVLESIDLPKILIAMIICRHYEIELRREMVYYVGRYQATVPEFKKVNLSTATLSELIDKVNKTKQIYEKYNDNLLIQAQISKRNAKAYEESRRKKLPNQLLTITKSVQDKLLTISVQIENCTNLLDVVNVLFDAGIETQIAVDSDGIAEGGIMLNEIQEIVVRICKVLMPPDKPAYTVKDECLGTFAIDREREDVILALNDVKNEYNKIIDIISRDADRFEQMKESIRQYEDIMINKMGQLCGHIDNYMTKINDGDYEEITTSRLRSLSQIYIEVNDYMKNVMEKSGMSENRNEIVNELNNIKNQYYKILELIKTDKKYEAEQETVREYEIMLINSLSKVCDNIENCDTKVENGEYDEFTVYKLQRIIDIYIEYYGYVKNIMEAQQLPENKFKV